MLAPPNVTAIDLSDLPSINCETAEKPFLSIIFNSLASNVFFCEFEI